MEYMSLSIRLIYFKWKNINEQFKGYGKYVNIKSKNLIIIFRFKIRWSCWKNSRYIRSFGIKRFKIISLNSFRFIEIKLKKLKKWWIKKSRKWG